MSSDRGIRTGTTLICAPLMADTAEEMVVLMNKAELCGADLVEVRLDSLKSFDPPRDVEFLIKQCPLPILFTYRFGNLNVCGFEFLMLLVMGYLSNANWKILLICDC